MHNFCLLALSLRSKNSNAHSVAAERPSSPAGRRFRGEPFQEHNHRKPLKLRPSMRPMRTDHYFLKFIFFSNIFQKMTKYFRFSQKVGYFRNFLKLRFSRSELAMSD